MLLAVANLGLFIWFLSSDKPAASKRAPVVEDRAAADISLVSEVDPAELTAPRADTRNSSSTGGAQESSRAAGQSLSADALCTLVGPFEEAYQGEDVARRLRALQVEASLREIEMQGQMRYWVYLAPLNSTKDAFRKLRELQAAGIDSYVIPKGSLENGISFGIFSEIERAQALTEELRERGFAAEYREEPQTYLERWVVLGAVGGGGDDAEGRVSPDAVADEFWEQLQLDYPEIDRRQNLCSEIRSGAEE